MVKNSLSRQQRGISWQFAIYLCSQSKSQDVKELKKNIAILLQHEKFQQSFTETSAQANNITCVHLAKKDI